MKKSIVFCLVMGCMTTNNGGSQVMVTVDAAVNTPADTAAAVDTAVTDMGMIDTAMPDTAPIDTGVADTGTLDTGIDVPIDTAMIDTIVADMGIDVPIDTGSPDAGIIDTGTADAGSDAAMDAGADVVIHTPFDPTARIVIATAGMRQPVVFSEVSPIARTLCPTSSTSCGVTYCRDIVPEFDALANEMHFSISTDGHVALVLVGMDCTVLSSTFLIDMFDQASGQALDWNLEPGPAGSCIMVLDIDLPLRYYGGLRTLAEFEAAARSRADAGSCIPDAGTPDVVMADTVPIDSGSPDVGTIDSGIVDTGMIDAGSDVAIDTAIADAAIADMGTADAGTGGRYLYWFQYSRTFWGAATMAGFISPADGYHAVNCTNTPTGAADDSVVSVIGGETLVTVRCVVPDLQPSFVGRFINAAGSELHTSYETAAGSCARAPHVNVLPVMDLVAGTVVLDPSRVVDQFYPFPGFRQCRHAAGP